MAARRGPLAPAPLLRARGLAAAPPGAAEVVRGFDLDLEPGGWVALTGPNGCGKTTLLLALAGLAPVRSGTLEVAGRPAARTALRDAVAVVLQEPESQLLQDTVRGEIGFGASNRGALPAAVAERVERLARELGLEGDLERDPRELSAGRQQLVLAAAALAEETPILMLDEAGAHLDREARRRLIALVGRRMRDGGAVVWVSQEPEELAAAQRVVRLEAGAAEPEPGAGAPPAAAPGPPAGSLGSVRVAPPPPGPGPRIETEPLVLVLPGSGVVSIEGRNGAGKSVLLAAIAGVQPCSQVLVEWRGASTAPPLLASQYPELQIFEERAADEVVFAAVSRGAPRRAATELARSHLTGLGLGPGFLERRTYDLSAGEKRILQVVAALIAPAGMCLLDEPTAGLDGVRRRALSGLVRERSRRGPILVATQDLDWIAGLADLRVRLGYPSDVGPADDR